MRSMQRRRRHEGKTDYNLRLGLLKSDKPRFVVRKSNRYITIQLVKSEIAQDKVLSTFNSKDLLSKGWPKDKSGSLKSLSAAYVSGYLAAKEAQSKGIKSAILDMGLYRNVKKSRIYAVVKGAVDAGLDIPSDSEAFPEIELDSKIKSMIK